MTWRIVADENMPCVRELFGRLGQVSLKPGRAITRQDLLDADVLLVRSVTRVDAGLLADTPVRFVGSATIGEDHVDRAALAARGIQFVNAPGCNARAVVEYVLTALFYVATREQLPWRQWSVGIVGAGNVGGRLAQTLRTLGLEVLCCDPPQAERGVEGRVSLQDVLRCPVVSLHLPLTHAGPHATAHLIDRAAIDGLASGTVLINTGRGDTLDGNALRDRLMRRADLHAILDVWEHEPSPDPGLVSLVRLATPHVAGHTVEGKWRGTWDIWRAFLAWSGGIATDDFHALLAHQPAPVMAVPEASPEAIARVLSAVFPIEEDDVLFRRAMQSSDRGVAFDRLRRHYRHRREFASVTWCEADRFRRWSAEDLRCLRALGFALPEECA